METTLVQAHKCNSENSQPHKFRWDTLCYLNYDRIIVTNGGLLFCDLDYLCYTHCQCNHHYTHKLQHLYCTFHLYNWGCTLHIYETKGYNVRKIIIVIVFTLEWDFYRICIMIARFTMSLIVVMPFH